jgi:FAD/FMN-containing dehydrogenase
VSGRPRASDDGLRDQLAAAVGEGHVLEDPDLKASYETDWTGRWSGRARFVVRPADAGEVAAALMACGDQGAAVVPQGGNSGLVGGSVPRDGEVVLSLQRLTEIEPIDATAGQVVAGAGATLESLQAHLMGTGFAFGVDHAARGTASIGGMVATNAGGVHVVRHGVMRAQVAGLEAVLADGRILARLSGSLKDNAGYDLPGLLTGSEGTLGVVTRVRLRLVRKLPRHATALFAVDDTAAALRLFARLRSRLPSLEAAEIFYADGLELVCGHRGISPPFATDHPAYLLVECGDTRDPVQELAAAVDDADQGVREVAVADETSRREDLWTYREAHTEAINAVGTPLKLDVGLPIRALADFEREVRERVEEVVPDARTVIFGHLGDGNLHVNVLGAEPDDERVEGAVLRLVAECGGSISAEHGIGLAKTKWLSLTRSRAEIAVMTALKQALDPKGILNPGVLLPEGGSRRGSDHGVH